MEPITLAGILSWCAANWGTVAAIGGAIVAWIIPDKYKDDWGYKVGRKLSQSMVHRIGKAVWEPIEIGLEKIGLRFVKAFFEGLNSDDFDVPVK